MAAKDNFKLHAAIPITNMMDTEKALMHVTVSKGGVALPSLPAGMSLTWAPADANITVDATMGIDGVTPNTDPLAAVAKAVKGVAADTTIKVTLPANADGTIPEDDFGFHITLNPSAADLSLAGTVDPPVAQ
jgi:hypothetical protein